MFLSIIMYITLLIWFTVEIYQSLNHNVTFRLIIYLNKLNGFDLLFLKNRRRKMLKA